MRLLYILILSLSAQAAFGKGKRNFQPGLDIGLSGAQVQVESENYLCDESSTCTKLNDTIAQSGLSYGLFLEKIMSPTIYGKIFSFDYGFGFSLRQINLDSKENETPRMITNSDGSVSVGSDYRLKIRLLGFQPYGYTRFGLALPYLPWFLLTTGIGFQYFKGNLDSDIDDRSRAISGYDIGYELKFEIVWLRMSFAWLTTYLTILPNSRPIAMRERGEEQNIYPMRVWSSGMGVTLQVFMF